MQVMYLCLAGWWVYGGSSMCEWMLWSEQARNGRCACCVAPQPEASATTTHRSGCSQSGITTRQIGAGQRGRQARGMSVSYHGRPEGGEAARPTMLQTHTQRGAVEAMDAAAATKEHTARWGSGGMSARRCEEPIESATPSRRLARQSPSAPRSHSRGCRGSHHHAGRSFSVAAIRSGRARRRQGVIERPSRPFDCGESFPNQGVWQPPATVQRSAI
jgi:hypothetical protein